MITGYIFKRLVGGYLLNLAWGAIIHVEPVWRATIDQSNHDATDAVACRQVQVQNEEIRRMCAYVIKRSNKWFIARFASNLGQELPWCGTFDCAAITVQAPIVNQFVWLIQLMMVCTILAVVAQILKFFQVKKWKKKLN